MRRIDLTYAVAPEQDGQPVVTLDERLLARPGGTYTGMVYHFRHHGMAGTYIDLPGHIKETDDGLDAASYPLEKLFRVDAAVVHLDRESGSGGITGEELAAAHQRGAPAGALVLNALGPRRFDAIAERSVWLAKDAVQWIVDTGIHLFVSDVYERQPEPLGTFYDLFAAGIATVCCPVNLHRLDAPRCRITALPARFPTVTQLPCRLVAEIDEP